jgi:small nuclear ribonucleoprotein (snRNP)-like protein
MDSRTSLGGPLEILKFLRNCQVRVTLKDLTEVTGLLKGYDEHLNLFLYKSRIEDEMNDILFIRGDLVVLMREL